MDPQSQFSSYTETMSSLSPSTLISGDHSPLAMNDCVESISPKSSPINLYPTETSNYDTNALQENSNSNHNSPLRFSFLFKNENKTSSQIGYSPSSSEHFESSPKSHEFLPILSQCWRPCTGDTTIGHYLDNSQFPISYRDLVYRWTALQCPTLQNLRIPLNLRTKKSYRPSSSSNPPLLNLQEICEAQEKSVIESIEENFEIGFTSQHRLFIGFASHLDIYCALHAELKCLEEGIEDLRTQYELYEQAWQNLLQAFDLDRTICTARSEHQDCLGYLLYGEVFFWPLPEIQRRFETYKSRSSSIRKPIEQFETHYCGSSNNLTNMNSFSTLTPSSSAQSALSTLGITVESPTSGFTSEWPRNFPSSVNASSNTSLTSLGSSTINSFGDISPVAPGTPWIQHEMCHGHNSPVIRKGHSSMPSHNDEMWRSTLSMLQAIEMSGQNRSMENVNEDRIQEKGIETTSIGYFDSANHFFEGVDAKVSNNSQTLSVIPTLSHSISTPNFVQQSSSQPFSLPTSPLTKGLSDLHPINPSQGTSQKRLRESETISESIITQLAKRLDRRMSIEKSYSGSGDDCLDVDADGSSNKYGKILKDIASQLEAAVRTMGDKNGSVSVPQPIDEGNLTENCKGRELQEGNDDRSKASRFPIARLRRPSRPRSHTTESEIHLNLQKIIKAIGSEKD